MNRKEYIELVNDWNNFLKEETNYSNEKLIIESILLNENKLKNLAKKLKTTTTVVSIALGLFLSNQANAQKNYNNKNYNNSTQEAAAVLQKNKNGVLEYVFQDYHLYSNMYKSQNKNFKDYYNKIIESCKTTQHKNAKKVANHFKILIKIYEQAEKASKISVNNFKKISVESNYDIENDIGWHDKYEEDLLKSKLIPIKESIIKNLEMLSLEKTRISKLKNDFKNWDVINDFEKGEDLFHNISEEIFEQETGSRDPADLNN